jgi:sulfur carrier protein
LKDIHPKGSPAFREDRDPMKLTINGRDRVFAELDTDSRLHHLVELLQLKADRVAVERNGEIVPRAQWVDTLVEDGDKLEVVQFVGGGSSLSSMAKPRSAIAEASHAPAQLGSASEFVTVSKMALPPTR